MNTSMNRSVGLNVEQLDGRDVPSAVVADYGGSGVWRYTPGTSGGTWIQLTAANPDTNGLAVANNGNTVVADFGEAGGLWRWTLSTGWTQMSGVNTEGLQVNDNGDVFADFGAAGGLWRWAAPPSGWVQLSGLNAQQISSDSGGTGPSVLAADFGASGLWQWTPAVGWRFISSANAEDISVAANGMIYADFGVSGGIWQWTPPSGFFAASWSQVATYNPEGISTGTGAFGATILYRDRGVMGVWSNNSELSSTNPDQIAGGTGDVYVDFGGSGIWRYDAVNGGWLQLNFANAEFIAVG